MTAHNRVKVNAAGVALGVDFTLGSPTESFVAFSNGDVVYTVLADTGEWQIARGTVTGSVLSRGTVEINHLGTTNQIDFSGKTLQIAETLSAADINSLISNSHTHTNKAILDNIQVAFTQFMATKLEGIEEGATTDQIALDVPFTPGQGLVSANVQDAILEVKVDTQDVARTYSPVISGVESGLLLSQLSSTTFQVATGTGIITEYYNNVENPTVTIVTNSITKSEDIEVFGYDANVTKIYLTKTNTVFQTSDHTDYSQIRDKILLGLIYTLDGVIHEIVNCPNIVKQTPTHNYDIMVETSTLTGCELGAVTGALSIWVNAGRLVYPNINWQTTPKDPNQRILAALGGGASAISFYPMYSDGAIVTTTTHLIPKYYNASAADLTALTGTEATIHRIYMLGVSDTARKVVLLYGQNKYTNAATAINSLETDIENTTIPDALSNLVFLGYVCIGADAANFGDSSTGWIISDKGISTGSTGTSDHTLLANRDDSDQHPITAIGDGTVEGQLDTLLDERITWVPKWIDATYPANTMIVDGQWTMISNIETSDRPGPQFAGEAVYLFDGTWASTNASAKQLTYGTRYYWADAAGYLTHINLYTVTGNHYIVAVVANPTGTPVTTVLLDFTADETGWNEFDIINQLIALGAIFDIVVRETEVDGTPTTWSGNWDYVTPVNDAPSTGKIVHNSDTPNLLHVFDIDDDSTDQSTDLAAVAIGDTIAVGGITFYVEGITDNGTYWTFEVFPYAQGATGVQSVVFTDITATSLVYYWDEDYWLNDATGTGLYIADGNYDDIVLTDDAYSVDIKVQPITFSADWDVVATSANGIGAATSQVSVLSVNGRTGTVVLNAADVNLENVANLAPADLPISDDVQAALDLKSDSDHIHASYLANVIEDTTPELGGALATKGQDINLTESDDSFKAKIISDLADKVVLSYNDTDEYDQYSGGITLSKKGILAEGAIFQLDGQTINGDCQLHISADGILFPKLSPTDLWNVSTTDTADYNLTTLSTWVKITGLEVIVAADTADGSPLNVKSVLTLVNSNSLYGGRVQVGFGVNGVAPSTGPIVDMVKGVSMTLPVTACTTAHGGLSLNDDITLWCRRYDEDNAAFDPSVVGSGADANELEVSVPGSGAGSSAIWGGITGTLSNQTDLDTVLASKAELDTSNDFTKPQLISSDGGELVAGSHTLNLDNFTNYALTSGSYIINAPTFTSSGARDKMRTGTIHIATAVDSALFDSIWKFNKGITPPGSLEGVVFYTVMSPTLIVCDWWAIA